MKKILLLLLVASVSVACLSAQDDDTRDYIIFSNNRFLFTSYLRVGAHVNTDVSMVEGGGVWNVADGYNGMRFMNEANYNEWMVGYESDRESGSWWGGAYIRVAFDIPDFSAGWLNISDKDYGIVLPEAFFRMGFAEKDWNLWLGRRYNDKIAIGMMDYYVANLDGNGGGVENIALGGAAMDVHWLFSYDTSALDSGAFLGKQTLAMHFRGIPVGDHNMSVIFAPSFIVGGDAADWDADGDGSGDGPASFESRAGAFATVMYNRSCFFGLDGGSQTYVSAGFGTGANQHVDTDLNDYDWDDWSVLAGFHGSGIVNDMFSFRTALHYEHRSYETSVNDFLSFGLRPMFKLAPIFGLQFEYDLEVAFTTGAMVNRITFAPTFTPPGGNVNSAVQVMPYVSYGYGDFSNPDAVRIGSSDHGLTWGLFGHVGF